MHGVAEFVQALLVWLGLGWLVAAWLPGVMLVLGSIPVAGSLLQKQPPK